MVLMKYSGGKYGCCRKCFYFDWEIALIQWFQTIGSDFCTKLMGVFSMLCEPKVLVVIALLLYVGLNKKAGKYLILSLELTLLSGAMIKKIFFRKRPYFVSDDVDCLKIVEPEYDLYDISAQGYSFPSIHSSMGVGVYGSVADFFRSKKGAVIVALISLLVGISRVYTGNHFPTDVLVGWLLGAVCLALLHFLRKKFENESVICGIIALAAIPGLFYCTSSDFFTGLGIAIGSFCGFLFEEKVVRFEDTRNIPELIARFLLGLGVYGAASALLKMPFSKEFLSSSTMTSYLVRTGRYAISLFLVCGLYPMCFKPLAKLFLKDEPKADGE